MYVRQQVYEQLNVCDPVSLSEMDFLSLLERFEKMCMLTSLTSIHALSNVCPRVLIHRIEQFEEQLNAAIKRFAPSRQSSSRSGTPTAAAAAAAADCAFGSLSGGRSSLTSEQVCEAL